MENSKRIPIGIEDFTKLRSQGFYYIDKTGLIKELLDNWGQVNLFTRPRRFGKTLNMSMLRHFFRIGCDRSLFDGLAVSGQRELCDRYMGKFPVISISLKGINGENYETARAMMIRLIIEEADRVRREIEWEKLSEYQRNIIKRLMDYNMEDADLMSSLRSLSSILESCFGQKVILLIDEYDVPLDKAFEKGYYDQMVMLIRNVFEQALKTNDSLYFSVLTGCLRIAKESIFTGLNNFKVFSITDVRYHEYFGFTDQEVRKLLEDYNLSDRYDTVRQWYDGYRFGAADVYCPWDVLCYCDSVLADPTAEPEAYWINTSSNSIVKRFIQKANKTTKRELEQLMDGNSVRKEIRQDLTYNEIDTTIDHLWSVLFTTGYLTCRGRAAGGWYDLVIPNLEVQKIFETQVREWFRETALQDKPRLQAFCDALKNGDTDMVEELFRSYLLKTIRIRDTCVRKNQKENFYHGILLGLLSFHEDWIVFSNAETGEGYGDILIEIEEEETGIVIEIKYADRDAMEEGCQEALRQIEEKDYTEKLRTDGMKNILVYGIACFQKRCRVMGGRSVHEY